MSSGRNIIIGGGISGLAAAHYLSKRGLPATVIEARPYLGGVLRTEQIEGCTVEAGADSWLASKPWAAELAREVGLERSLIGSNDAIRRTFIWKRGELLPFPTGMQLVAPTRFGPVWGSRLLSFETKARMTLDWFRRPGTALPERSVAAFVGEHFGREAVDYLAEPLLTGIYGGSPDDLSASSVIPKLVEQERVHGSLVRGLPQAKITGSLFQSLRHGLGSLIDALRPAEFIHGTAERILSLPDGYRVFVNGNWINADHLILACESHAAATLLAGIEPAISERLGAIRHSSGHIIAFGFRRSEVRHPLNGFGFLVPKVEGRNLMAATWMNAKFPERTPPDLILIRAFFRESPCEPLGDLREMMGITAEPFFLRQYDWPRSLPQYSVGHSERMAEIDGLISTVPGLHLIGNAYHGVGIPDCVRLARQAVARIFPR